MAPLPSLSVTYLVHVLACLGRCFHIGDGPLLRPHLALAERHLPFIVKIAFVAHQQERYALIVFHPQYLFSTKCQEREGSMSNNLNEIGLVLLDSRVCQWLTASKHTHTHIQHQYWSSHTWSHFIIDKTAPAVTCRWQRTTLSWEQRRRERCLCCVELSCFAHISNGVNKGKGNLLSIVWVGLYKG